MLHLKAVLKTLSCALLCAVMLIAAVPAIQEGVGAQGTMLIVDPPSAEVVIGDTVTVDLAVRDVTNLYGVALEVHFDPAVVEVDGTSVTPGSCPSPDFVVQNSVDNVGGVIRYDTSSLSPSAPCTGDGVIASVTFRRLAPGTTTVDYADWLLSDPDGLVIQTSTQSGTLTEPQGPPATLIIDPAASATTTGGTVTVDFAVRDIADLYGVALEVHFDPTLVQVVDADGGTAGVQIAPGACPSPDFVVQNSADNTTGVILYDASSLSPSVPCAGDGVIASVTFRGLSDGVSPVEYANWLLSDTNGIVLPVTVQDGSVEVAGPSAQLATDPVQATVNVSGTTTVDIVVTDPGDLYGIELALSFDPALVEVVDDDPGTAGVQITPGTCPIPNFVAENAADNSAGTIRYGATSLSPSGPCTAGGIVASITFHGLSGGQSALAFTSWVLSDPDGLVIATAAQDGSITVLNTGWASGNVELQGRLDHSGVEVCAWQGASSAACTTTDSAGDYELALPAGTYDMAVEMARYLDAGKSGVVIVAGATTPLSPVRLLGGDTNDDDNINIQDLSLIGSRFRLNCGDPGWDARADINNDCSVNLSDLVLAGGNWHRTSPVTWP